jgi:glycosyltransferase involved in cell wall biosynthesis
MRILFCGQSGIPGNRSATLNRYYAIAHAMKDDNEIIFINRVPMNKEGDQYETDFPFRIVEATNQKNRSNSFVIRNFMKIFSSFYEFRTLKRVNKEKKIDWLNVYTQFFGICIFYYISSKIFRFKTIFHYVEKRSEFNDRGLLMKCNDFLLERFALYLFDRIIPISHKLNEEIAARVSRKKTLIIPPICDFDYFDQVRIKRSDNGKYFLYCGSSAYNSVVDLILNSYGQLISSNIKLYLVLNGKISEEIRNKVLKSNGQIQLFSNLDYLDLIALYKNSLALLIPLRNTAQDIARFPQKICEYIASRKIIVSTNLGEVKYYFQDKQNALLADNYDIDSYSSKLQWILENKSELIKMEEESYYQGRLHFDISSYTQKLKEFIK